MEILYLKYVGGDKELAHRIMTEPLMLASFRRGIGDRTLILGGCVWLIRAQSRSIGQGGTFPFWTVLNLGFGLLDLPFRGFRYQCTLNNSGILKERGCGTVVGLVCGDAWLTLYANCIQFL